MPDRPCTMNEAKSADWPMAADLRTDRHLLQRFACHREEDAFAALVHRHGPTVLATCRRVLGDTSEADDAFQATFLVLARKAEGVWQDSVRNWLCAAAHRLACTLGPRNAAGVAGKPWWNKIGTALIWRIRSTRCAKVTRRESCSPPGR